MLRFLVNTAVYFTAAAIGLIIADVVLDDMSIVYPVGFVVAALIFGVIQAVLAPFFLSVAEKSAALLTSGVGLFTAFVALVLTTLISDDLTIEGALTWLLAALIIWLASMFATFILKVTVAKKVIREIRD
jgi:uncharacterized membrane protein YvlD (DUF360 family)